MIVETARGVEYGTVVGGIREVDNAKVVQPLKPVLRIATERDDEQEAANKVREKKAFGICQEKIRKHKLDMKLIDAEYTFDNNKVLFYFTADGRIDFRELVKDLAGRVQDQDRAAADRRAGRDQILEASAPAAGSSAAIPICRSSFGIHQDGEGTESFPEPVQDIRRLRPSDVLSEHEEETYEDLNRRLPNPGDFVTTDDGLRER